MFSGSPDAFRKHAPIEFLPLLLELATSSELFHATDVIVALGPPAITPLVDSLIERLAHPDSEIRELALGKLDEIYDRLAPDMQSSLRGRGASPKGQLSGIEDQPPPPGFRSVQRDELRWERTYTSEEWVGLLRTHSDHRLLAPDHRAEVHDAVRAAIDAHGGSFTLPYRVELLRFRT